jgi:hypothetical protein
MEDSYFARIIKHYLLLALSKESIRIDSDTHAELSDAMDDLEHQIRRIVRDEVRRAIASNMEA